MSNQNDSKEAKAEYCDTCKRGIGLADGEDCGTDKRILFCYEPIASSPDHIVDANKNVNSDKAS